VNYQLEFDTLAVREIKALPANIRSIARQLFHDLAIEPRPPRSKELRDKPGIYRIWLAGNWRVVYTINDDQSLVTILRVRLKADIDYDSLSGE
jgi:mRNA-degrading endonuclease RelE of RelBE toxin-antitoxin system